MKHLLRKIALLIVAVIVFGIFRVFANFVFQIQQSDLIETNLKKVKVGMSSAEVEALLGWPDERYLNTKDELVRLPITQVLSWLRITSTYSFKKDDCWGKPINTQGREAWLYWDWDSSIRARKLRANQDPSYRETYGGYPTIVFDVKTGKVVQLTEAYYED